MISPQGLFGWSFQSHDKMLNLVWRRLTVTWTQQGWREALTSSTVMQENKSPCCSSPIAGSDPRLRADVQRQIPQAGRISVQRGKRVMHTHTGAIFKWEADVLIICCMMKICVCWWIWLFAFGALLLFSKEATHSRLSSWNLVFRSV